MPKSGHTAKYGFVVCLVGGTRRSRISPCVPVSSCGFGVAHGKYDFHRVPEELHTAKFLAHGELLVSGSAVYKLSNTYIRVVQPPFVSL